MLSALYAKLLVIMGICFPLAEVISKKIPVSFYEVSTRTLTASTLNGISLFYVPLCNTVHIRYTHNDFIFAVLDTLVVA